MSLLKNISNFLFPSYCAVCGRRLVAGEETICLHCNIKLPRTYQWNNPSDNKLARLFWGKVNINKAVAYIYHQPHSDTANIIYDMKYHHHPEDARHIGKMLADEIGATGFFDDIDVIVPVPVTAERRKERGYNQCEEMAVGITSRYAIPIERNAIRRVSGSLSQTTQTRFGRWENISGAFVLKPASASLQGKHCLLLDDVITTGSTLTECAKTLSGIPGISFSVLSFSCINRM